MRVAGQSGVELLLEVQEGLPAFEFIRKRGAPFSRQVVILRFVIQLLVHHPFKEVKGKFLAHTYLFTKALCSTGS